MSSLTVRVPLTALYKTSETSDEQYERTQSLGLLMCQTMRVPPFLPIAQLDLRAAGNDVADLLRSM